MQLVLAVSVEGASWRIHVELPSGRSDVFREACWVGSARYRPASGWMAIDPDTPEIRAALAATIVELRPFADAMGDDA